MTKGTNLGGPRFFGVGRRGRPRFSFHGNVFKQKNSRKPVAREGANREKLTVKKIINKEMFFFHRLCPLQTVKNRRKPWKNRHQTVKKSAPKIHHFFTVSFSPFTSSWVAVLSSLREKFSRILRRSGHILPHFPGPWHAIPARVFGAPGLGSPCRRGSPRFVPISSVFFPDLFSDLHSLFSGIPRFFPICSDILVRCSFCHLDFVKEFPRFGCKILAKISESRLKSAKTRPKFDSNSTKSRPNLS